MARYRIDIPYTEPLFSLKNGRPADHLYPGEFTVEAGNEAEAIEVALGRFECVAEASAVGWQRTPSLPHIRAQRVLLRLV